MTTCLRQQSRWHSWTLMHPCHHHHHSRQQQEQQTASAMLRTACTRVRGGVFVSVCGGEGRACQNTAISWWRGRKRWCGEALQQRGGKRRTFTTHQPPTCEWPLLLLIQMSWPLLLLIQRNRPLCPNCNWISNSSGQFHVGGRCVAHVCLFPPCSLLLLSTPTHYLTHQPHRPTKRTRQPPPTRTLHTHAHTPYQHPHTHWPQVLPPMVSSVPSWCTSGALPPLCWTLRALWPPSALWQM